MDKVQRKDVRHVQVGKGVWAAPVAPVTVLAGHRTQQGLEPTVHGVRRLRAALEEWIRPGGALPPAAPFAMRARP